MPDASEGFLEGLLDIPWAKTPTTSVFLSLDSGHGCLVVGYCPKQQTPETIDPQFRKNLNPLLGFGVPHFSTFFLKGTIMKIKVYTFFLPGYLKAQFWHLDEDEILRLRHLCSPPLAVQLVPGR